MAEFTDEELLFLSNLMHIKKEEDSKGVFQDIWTQKSNGEVLGVLLQDYLTDENIEAMRQSDYVYNGEISSEEWADMLQGLKADAEAARAAGEECLLDLKI